MSIIRFFGGRQGNFCINIAMGVEDMGLLLMKNAYQISVAVKQSHGCKGYGIDPEAVFFCL
jgi:hypothetical protein